jgi:hypothetical protein
MASAWLYRSLTLAIALVWLANGLFCKVLHLVPRHEQIVARILGPAHAHGLTMAIGVAEMGMATWVASGIKQRWSAAAQIVLVVAMNTLEFVLAPDLLLWGPYNAVFAGLFALLIYYNAFTLARPTVS